MALRDFKQYVGKTLAQYLEMKNDLADYEEAVKAGQITEDKLVEVKEYVARLEENYNRLLFAAYLLELPNRSEKKAKFNKSKANQALASEFDKLNASQQCVFDENKSLLDDIRKKLKEITKE